MIVLWRLDALLSGGLQLFLTANGDSKGCHGHHRAFVGAIFSGSCLATPYFELQFGTKSIQHIRLLVAVIQSNPSKKV